MKLLFVIKALANKGGGAEKVLSFIANGLAARGHEVSVLTNDPVGSSPFYSFESTVIIHRVAIGSVHRRAGFMETVRRMASYRKAVAAERPDVVIAFMHSAYIPASVALLGRGVSVVACEHTGPEHYQRRPLQKLLLQLTPLTCDQITVVSEQVRASFGRWLRKSMVVLPNPVVIRNGSTPVAAHTGRTILSVGRLGAEKGHSVLIEAFQRVSHTHPDWTLRIVGEGELRFDLERQVKAAGLVNQVFLPGAVSDVDSEYLRADLFVLPSVYESFGMATAEALLHGVPAIGFADCAGTNKLIVDGVNGRLVSGPNRVDALAEVLDELMSDSAQRKSLSLPVAVGPVAKLGIDDVLDEWERLLAALVLARADGGAEVPNSRSGVSR